ncbi:acyltransferase [Curtobacterium flaccumfaciens pv. flaccumfaciens]|uniref:acyltransferase family protein n=1 Tax=Curtobacterium flaccumfaciens TaxID=2035 RepID=UPI001ADB772F|nr:acyltransferase family protein [Curtobacterium flaccumfaciens]MBO9047297.1 acyltransferase [Curtobacterium flaccumfaciens pv. flaccumfaciens]MBO9058660.1 acyltransferase [Curtobacterium flaccumfaciens pv. flaccumfaciens]QTR92151.1 acyltransferase [Curtobacterium flaccumfaciens pv. flaccumfaciens]QVG67450.1 acyltransferase [Curtobacterium flaccumfaciens pv. flaccumfaciens]
MRRAKDGSDGPQRGFRADIQGIRAVAIALVILYHLWPNRITGGYVGVDVFFVISGFLITGHILKAAEREQPVPMLIGFYARRIRRLAPAAVVVLVAVLVFTVLLLPASTWSATGSNVLAASLFSENWFLAAQSVSYLDADAVPSAVQHFWSLSVEEQFYIVWPLVLLAAIALLARRRATWIVVVIGAVGIVSFCWGLLHTATNQDAAFFDTTARAWQFAVGALVAFVPLPGPRTRLWVPWVGLAAIAAAALLYSEATPFPGIAAVLPTVGAAVVIAGRAPAAEPWSFGFLASFGPVRWLGDVSYSAYLWHWPLIILVPQWLGVDLGLRLKLAILCATVVLAWASHRYVENPVRRSAVLTKRRRRSFVAGGATLLVLVAGCFGTVGVANAQMDAADDRLLAQVTGGQTCLGAGAIGDRSCADPWGDIDVADVPAPLSDKPLVWKDDCIDDVTENTEKYCTYGDPDASETLLLWGDSHAGAWSSAFDIAGKLDHVKVIVAARNRCPSSMEAPTGTTYGDVIPADQRGWCAARNDWVMKTLVPRADRVVLADLWANYRFAGTDSAQADGYSELIDGVRDAGLPVTMLQHVPLTGQTLEDKVIGPSCLASGGSCTNDVAHALPPSTSLPQRLLVDEGYGDVVRWVPVESQFCHDGRCYSAIGGVSVYFDGSHLSNTYSASLGPWLATALDRTQPLSVVG